jgi:hypothetical protein
MVAEPGFIPALAGGATENSPAIYRLLPGGDLFIVP